MSILVCGDAMIDRYLWGNVTRISPEAPIPIARIERIEERPGGAANVVENVRALGSVVRGVFSPSEAPVVKIRVIGKNQQMLRIDFDSPQIPISADAIIADMASTVIFSDYGKGTLLEVHKLIEVCRGRTILVDPKGFDYERYRGAHLIKPNKDEMKELVGGWFTEDQLTVKAQNLREELRLKGILLTRAAEGMVLYMEGVTHSIEAQAADIYDVSGAGDTTIATFAVALDRGYSWLDAARYANKAAGIAVGHFGTYVVNEKEVFNV